MCYYLNVQFQGQRVNVVLSAYRPPFFIPKHDITFFQSVKAADRLNIKRTVFRDTKRTCGGSEVLRIVVISLLNFTV